MVLCLIFRLKPLAVGKVKLILVKRWKALRRFVVFDDIFYIVQ